MAWIGGLAGALVGGFIADRYVKMRFISSAVAGVIAILGYIYIPV